MVLQNVQVDVALGEDVAIVRQDGNALLLLPSTSTPVGVFYQTIINGDGGAMLQEPALEFNSDFTLTDSPGLSTRISLQRRPLPSVGLTDAGERLAVNGAGAWDTAANGFLNFTTTALRDSYAGLRTAGMLTYVSTTQCLYMLAPDLTTWLFFAPSPALGGQAAWFIATTGNDNNDGLTLGTALRNVEELGRRLSPAGGLCTLTNAVTTVTIGAGSFGQLNLRVTWPNSFGSFGAQLFILGALSSSASITLAAGTVNTTQGSVRAQVVTAAGTFVNQLRIRAISGTHTGAITYSNGLNGDAQHSFVQPWSDFATGNSLFSPAVGDNVVVDTLLTTVESLTVSQFGAGGYFQYQDLIAQNIFVTNDNNTGIFGDGGPYIFGCENGLDASGACEWSAINGANAFSCRIKTTCILIGSAWELNGCAIQASARLTGPTSLRLRNGNAIDAGVFATAGFVVGDSLKGGVSQIVNIGTGVELENGQAGSTAFNLLDSSSMLIQQPFWGLAGTWGKGFSFATATSLDPGTVPTFPCTIGYATPSGNFAFTETPVLVGGGVTITASGLSLTNDAKYLTAQTGNLASVSLFGGGNPRKGSYAVGGYVAVTVVGTTGPLNLNVNFTDDSGVARTVQICTLALINALGGQGGTVEIECNGTTPVTLSVTGIVTPGTLQYSLRGNVRIDSNG